MIHPYLLSVLALVGAVMVLTALFLQPGRRLVLALVIIGAAVLLSEWNRIRLQAQGRGATKESIYRDTLRKSPDKPRPHLQLCQMLLEQNRVDEARLVCQQTVAVADRRARERPNDAVISGLIAEGAMIDLAALELSYAERDVTTGEVRFTRLDAARRLLLEVFRRDPHTPVAEAYLNFGVTYLRARQPANALVVIWQGRRVDPADKKLMFAEGAAYAQMGNCRFANIMWQSSFRRSLDFQGEVPKCTTN